MVPWLALPPCTLLGKAMTDYLMGREWSLTKVRKVVQSCCFLGQNIALFCMCHTTNFTAALICMTIVIGKVILYYFVVVTFEPIILLFQEELVFTTMP